MIHGEHQMRDRAWPLALRPLGLLLMPVAVVMCVAEWWKAWRLPRYVEKGWDER